MDNLAEALQQPNRRELLEVRQLCAEFGCRIDRPELQK